MNRSMNFFLFLVFLGFVFNLKAQYQFFSFERGFESTRVQSTLPKRDYKEISNAEYLLSYKFPGAYVNKKNIHGKEYSIFKIDGCFFNGEKGEPSLPSLKEVFAVPENATVRVSIIDSSYKEFPGFLMHPAYPIIYDTEGMPSPKFTIDSLAYNTNQFIPKNPSQIVHISKSRNTNLVSVGVNPVQYNPALNRVRVYSSLAIKVIIEGENISYDYIARGNSEHYTKLLKRRVINSSKIPMGKCRSAKNSDFAYIILTDVGYGSNAERLAKWKQQLGYRTKVILGVDWNKQRIKDSVYNAYNNAEVKPDYLLIIGDHNGAMGVPAHDMYNSVEGTTFYSDNKYCCMNGNNDYVPEMAYGRISVSTNEEANIVVDKIINYEKNPPANQNFYSTFLNCGAFQDDPNTIGGGNYDGYSSRRFIHTNEEIRSYLIGTFDYNSNRVYCSETTADVANLHYENGNFSSGQLLPEELRTELFNWDGDASDIVNQINQGKFLVIHRDHGYGDGRGWAHPLFSNASNANQVLDLMNDNLLPVVLSINCSSGNFTYTECFSESLLRQENGGAVGVVGATYLSATGFNDALCVGMIDAIWPNPGLCPDFGYFGSGQEYSYGENTGLKAMGDILQQGLLAMEKNSPYYCTEQQYKIFHWFGDPAMKIWTSNPYDSILTAIHSDTLNHNTDFFTVSGISPGAVVTIVDDNGLVDKKIVSNNCNGTITMDCSEVSSNELKLTISKENYLPYVADINVTGNFLYLPMLNTGDAVNTQSYSTTLYGELENDGGGEIYEYGFLYSNSVEGLDVTEYHIVTEEGSIPEGEYSVFVNNLNPGTSYYYMAYAKNQAGISYGNINSFTTLCGTHRTLPFEEQFGWGIVPMCWDVIDNKGNGQVWKFDNPGHRFLNSNSSSNGIAIIDSYYYGESGTQNSDLISKPFDFTNIYQISLNFEHFYYHYNNSVATLSYSIDGGSSWEIIDQWDTVSTINGEYENYELTALLTGKTNVRFKWSYTGAYSWYWAIDDVRLNLEGERLIPVWINIYDNSNYEPIVDGSVYIEDSVYKSDSLGWIGTFGHVTHYTFSIEAPGYFETEGEFDVTDCDRVLYVGLDPVPELIIYPNPVSHIVNICVPEVFNLIIYKSTGQVVFQEDFPGTAHVNVEEFESGIYFIRAEGEKKCYSGKFIVD